MKNKIDLIIGKEGLRNLFPGMTLDDVEREEGKPDSDEQAYIPYYEYEKELEEGEEFIIYYSYDKESKKVTQIEFFFYFYPSAHDDSNDLFEELKKLIIEKYTKEAGKPREDHLGDDKDEEPYLYWDLTQNKTKHELVFTNYPDEDDDDPYNSRLVIKIVLNEKH